jgi:uncharacterized protein (TIGR00661 family)
MNEKSCILICPLNWGLGHASRDVYLISCLLERNYEVIIGGEGDTVEFLQNEFPDLTYIHFPSFQIRYSHHYPAWLMITLLLPYIIKCIVREKKLLHKVIRDYKIDLVISDARYGLWSSTIPSVIITHQISFKLPFLFKPLQYPVHIINRIAINRFSQCWIPDLPTSPNLSGDLSHRYKVPVHSLFIGPLSRFIKTGNETYATSKAFEVVVILSGPEPQRSIFEKIITDQLSLSDRKSAIICGKPGTKIPENLTDHCTKVPYLTGDELRTVLKSSKYIICRSGYSTIMDLISLKKTAMLIPTPGQTEQEYLARHLEKQGLFLYSKQKDFQLEEAIDMLDEFNPGKQFSKSFDLLDRAMEEIPLLLENNIRD